MPAAARGPGGAPDCTPRGLECHQQLPVPAAPAPARSGPTACSLLPAAVAPTTFEADLILRERGIKVLPDVVANGGGIVVSFFEWVRGKPPPRWRSKRKAAALPRCPVGTGPAASRSRLDSDPDRPPVPPPPPRPGPKPAELPVGGGGHHPALGQVGGRAHSPQLTRARAHTHTHTHTLTQTHTHTHTRTHTRLGT